MFKAKRRQKGHFIMDLNKFFYELDELLAKGQGEEAIAYIQTAMEEARKLDDTKALIAIYNEAGGLCRDFSKYEDAENYYTEALSLIIHIGAAGSESHGTTLINYGTCLANWQKYEEAIEMFSEAASILAGLGMGTDYRMAALYNNMSWVLQEQGKLEDASEYLNRALFLLNAVPDSEGEQAASLTNLANLYWEQGLLDEAKVTLLKALDIYKEQVHLRREGRYAAVIATLANIFFSEGDYERAATLCKEAMNEIEAEFGQNDAYKVIEANLQECENKLADAEAK